MAGVHRARSAPQVRAKPTVTSILRQQHVIEKSEKKDQEKVESLMVLNPTMILEGDNFVKRMEQQEFEENKKKEAKRVMEAKLAYARAKEANRKVLAEKQRIAEATRQKEREWLSLLAFQREADMQHRKSQTRLLQRSFQDSKKAFDDMLKLKQVKAAQIKMEMEQLQLEAREKEKAENLRRNDKIQQIQAAKIALRRTKDTSGNDKQFYRSIAIPETQIKLRLQKEEETRKLEEIRKKIQAAKQIKSVKLIKAMKKIQSVETMNMSKKQNVTTTKSNQPLATYTV